MIPTIATEPELSICYASSVISYLHEANRRPLNQSSPYMELVIVASKALLCESPQLCGISVSVCLLKAFACLVLM
jgi:hypothetical protein